MAPYVIIGVLVLALVVGFYFLVVRKRSETPGVDPEEAKVIEEKTTAATKADVKIVENKAKIEALKQGLTDEDETPDFSSTKDMTDDEVHAELVRRGELPK